MPARRPDEIADVILGCANQAGEDNRNVARMALLLAGLPSSVPGETVNRLCASGLSAVGERGARGSGQAKASLCRRRRREHDARAVMSFSKSAKPFGRDLEFFDTTLGWRFVNPAMKAKYGTDSMGQTAENVAEQYRRQPRRPGCVRAPFAAEGGGRARGGALRAGDRARRNRAEEGRAEAASSTTSSSAPTRRSRRWRELKPVVPRRTARAR